MTAFSLTRPQQKLLGFIVSYQAQHGLSPSFSDMATGLGIKSRYVLVNLMHGLKERGYVDWIPRHKRSIVVKRQPVFTLRPEVLAELYRFCEASGESPVAVVADAVALHLESFAAEKAP
jgi:SOS-response transcriptional repressor LexA